MGRLLHRSIPGASYFVTTDAWQRRSVFQVAETAEIVVNRILSCREKGAYLLHAFVLMPDHLHLLLTPAGNNSLEKVMQLIKGGSSHEVHSRRGTSNAIWQSGFHESSIRDANDFRAKQLYIQENPVRARLVIRFEDWPYGSGNSRFKMDAMPGRYSSGAKAPFTSSNVGAEAPTPEKSLSLARIAGRHP